MVIYATTPLKEVIEAAAGGSVGTGSALAVSLAAATASALCAVRSAYPEPDDAQAEALKHLELIYGYALKLVDEDVRALAPLKKRQENPDNSKERMEAALRIACGVPTELMYTAGRAAEQLAILAPGVKIDSAAAVGAAAEACRAVMDGAIMYIRSLAASMSDEIFAMTLRREGELVLAQYSSAFEAVSAAVREILG